MKRISELSCYTELNDTQLVELYQEGNLEGGELLIERYLPLVYSRVSALYNMGNEADRQDAISEGLVGLFSAIRHYKIDKGGSFKTFAYVCISNRLQSYREGACRRDKLEAHFITEIEDESIGSLEYDPSNIVVSRENSIAFDDTLKKKLTDLEYKSLLLFCSGLSYKEVALELNVTVKSVSGSIERARKKLESLLQSL